MKKPRRGLILIVMLLVVLIATGCGDAVPSTSFEVNESIEQKAQNSVKEHVKDNRDIAAESATQAEDSIKKGAADAYDKLWDAADNAQKVGVQGMAQKFLYDLYVIYYTLCDFAIPIICVGWGLALFFYFIFKKLKVPKYQKLAILWLGFFVTAVMIIMLALPSIIKGLGA